LLRLAFSEIGDFKTHSTFSILLSGWFVLRGTAGNEQDAGAGAGDGGGGGPTEMGKGLAGLGLFGGTDQEGQAAGGGYQGGGGGEDGGEVFDGAEGDYVEGARDGFGAGVLYIDVRQCKGAGDFAEEGGFLVVGLDQREGDSRGPEFDGEAGETGAGAYVGYGESLRG
jgi:hypothetical protein